MKNHNRNTQNGQAFLNGHTTDYHDKHERQQAICRRINKLEEIILGRDWGTHRGNDLTRMVTEYVELYDKSPTGLIAKLYELSDKLTDLAIRIDPLAEIALADMRKHLKKDKIEALIDAELWDMINNYGRESADYQGED